MICFAMADFFVTSFVPWHNPICLPFSLAVTRPSFVLWRRSDTSFSDCSKASLICFSAKDVRKQRNYKEKTPEALISHNVINLR
jgi:hypothetical protein